MTSKFLRNCLTLLGMISPTCCLAFAPLTPDHDQKLYDLYPWSILYYYGVTVNNPLAQVVVLNKLNRWPEDIQSIELARTLDPNNFLRRLVQPLVGIVEIAGNI